MAIPTGLFHTLDGIDAGLREVDLDALVRRQPVLANAPVSRLLLAESWIRNAPETAIDNLLDETVSFHPHRVLMQDYAGTPALMDIAALRDARIKHGGRATEIRLARPVDFVVDHSIIVEATGQGAEHYNIDREYTANAERFGFIRWAEQAFENLRVVPPGGGIVHQVNLEQLSEPVRVDGGWLMPDSLIGTDSHSTMAGGLGMLAWGVGGIEATSVLLGAPIQMRRPVVVGVELTGALPDGVLATDLALMLTAFLRGSGVVGTFLEFHGRGVANLRVTDRATIANMAPEYGATSVLFPADEETIRYLEASGRVEAAGRLARYLARQVVLGQRERSYDRLLRFDLAQVRPTIAGPMLPHEALDFSAVADCFATPHRSSGSLRDGDIVLAALTSCTNTANPAAMIAAGLLARNARARGLTVPRHVRTSLSPGSRQVARYLEDLGLLEPLQELGFWVVGYGCMTCVGNSGGLDSELGAAIEAGELNVAAVLSGNRNFQSRIHPQVRSNFLASPPLVVAMAIAGNLRGDLANDPLAEGSEGPCYLGDIWPKADEIEAALRRLDFSRRVENPHGRRWAELPAVAGDRFAWPRDSTFIAPPLLEADGPGPVVLPAARPLLVLGDAVTTDHISPVGRIAPDSPAGRYLLNLKVDRRELGTYGARRGNAAVMVRGTFANPRLLNALANDGQTRHQPSGTVDTVHAVAMRYTQEEQPIVIVAGNNYGVGSARDWAAKGTRALGVRVVLARSFERIHRANLALLGVLPIEYETMPDLTGDVCIAVSAPSDALEPGMPLPITITSSGQSMTVPGRCRLDTELELACWRSGGLLARSAAGA